jgi:hypothetical protein
MRSRPRPLLALLVLALAAGALTGDEETKPAPAGSLVVIDARGKEQKVTKYSFTDGTRRLGWLAEGKDKGPEALVIRDATKFAFLDGVVLYAPLTQVRSVSFDNKNETMTVRAAASDSEDDDVVTKGSTAYDDINKVTLAAEVDKGEAGVAELTFQGGVPKGIQGIRFPAPKVPAAGKKGRPAVVQSNDKGVKRTDKVTDLQPLYRLAGGQEKLGTVLMFKKTLKLDVSKIKKIVAGEGKGAEPVWQVTQKDEDEELSLTLLKTTKIDGKDATLAGLVGKAAGGYRFFPAARITQIDFDSAEKKPIKADTE